MLTSFDRKLNVCDTCRTPQGFATFLKSVVAQVLQYTYTGISKDIFNVLSL